MRPFLTAAASALLASSAMATLLSDNTAKSISGHESTTDTRWVVSSFGTAATPESLTSVTVIGYQASPGNALLSIYTDNSGQPGTPIGSLTAPATYTAIDGPNTFSTAGISLAANSTYWVVLGSPTGNFQWAWTGDMTGDGIGFQHTWGNTPDSGANWSIFPTAPQMMSVSTGVPEPTSLALIGTGAMLILRRRSK